MTVAGIPSLKELPVKEFSPADVLIAETSPAPETSPAATMLLPSNKLFCIYPIQSIKLFGIPKRISLSLLHVSEQIFKVCAYLTNFQDPIIAEIVPL